MPWPYSINHYPRGQIKTRHSITAARLYDFSVNPWLTVTHLLLSGSYLNSGRLGGLLLLLLLLLLAGNESGGRKGKNSDGLHINLN